MGCKDRYNILFDNAPIENIFKTSANTLFY